MALAEPEQRGHAALFRRGRRDAGNRASKTKARLRSVEHEIYDARGGGRDTWDRDDSPGRKPTRRVPDARVKWASTVRTPTINLTWRPSCQTAKASLTMIATLASRGLNQPSTATASLLRLVLRDGFLAGLSGRACDPAIWRISVSACSQFWSALPPVSIQMW